MDQNEFIFDVIVTKLELEKEPYLIPEDFIVEFVWGELSLPITSSRINVTNFSANKCIEFHSDENRLRESFLNKQFRITVFRQNTRKSRIVTEEPNNVEEDLVLEDGNNQGNSRELRNSVEFKGIGDIENLKDLQHEQGTSYKDENIVGECISQWPRDIFDFVNDEDLSEYPHKQTYDIYRKKRFAGTISLAFLIIKKCIENKESRASEKSYVDKNGQLSTYSEMKSKIGDDIFFVVGNAAGGQNQPNLLGSCGGKEPCTGRFDKSHFKMIHGKLVKDFNALPICGNVDCCNNKDVLDMYESIVNNVEIPSSCTSLAMPCDKVFGPISDCAALQATSNTSIHMPDCPVRNSNVQSQSNGDFDTSVSASSEQSNAEHSSGPKVKKFVKTIMKISRKKMKHHKKIPYTCSDPKLTKSDVELKPRSCPICCEDMSWVQALGPCPKCGFKPKIIFPAEQVAYNENQTAKQILEKWNADVKKFKTKNNINPLGICLCTSHKECINCHIRRITCREVDSENLDVDVNVDEALVNVVREQNAGVDRCNAEIISNIVDEVLSKPIAEPLSMEHEYLNLNQDTLPSIPKAMQWSRKQYPHLKKSENILFSESDISLRNRSSIFAVANDKKEEVRDENKDKKNEKKEHEKRLSKEQKHRLNKTQALRSEYCRVEKTYPPHVFGHKYCSPNAHRVPKNMGWYWNLHIEKERRGWRPGAINRKTYQVMSYFLSKANSPKPLEHSNPELEHCKNVDGIQLPRLHITKANGTYTVTLHPMRDLNLPASKCTDKMLPIEFKIAKANGALKRRQIRQCLKMAEYLKCEHGGLVPNKDQNKDQYDIAIKNLKDLLCEQDLRRICESQSDSENSMDIQIGGGTLNDLERHKVLRRNVETQVDNEIIPTRIEWSPDEDSYRSPTRLPASPSGGPNQPNRPKQESAIPVRPNKPGPTVEPAKPGIAGKPGKSGSKPYKSGTKPDHPGSKLSKPNKLPADNKPSGNKPVRTKPDQPGSKLSKPNKLPADNKPSGNKPVQPDRPGKPSKPEKPHFPGYVPEDTVPGNQRPPSKPDQKPPHHNTPPQKPPHQKPLPQKPPPQKPLHQNPLDQKPPYQKPPHQKSPANETPNNPDKSKSASPSRPARPSPAKPSEPPKPKEKQTRPSSERSPSTRPPYRQPSRFHKPFYYEDKGVKTALKCHVAEDPCIESPLTFVQFRPLRCDEYDVPAETLATATFRAKSISNRSPHLCESMQCARIAAQRRGSAKGCSARYLPAPIK